MTLDHTLDCSRPQGWSQLSLTKCRLTCRLDDLPLSSSQTPARNQASIASPVRSQQLQEQVLQQEQQQQSQDQQSQEQQERQESQGQQSPLVGTSEMAAALERLCQAATRRQQGAHASTSGSNASSRTSPRHKSSSKGHHRGRSDASSAASPSSSVTSPKTSPRHAAGQHRRHHDAAAHASSSSICTPHRASPKHVFGSNSQHRLPASAAGSVSASDANASVLSNSVSHAMPADRAQTEIRASSSHAHAEGSTEKLLDAFMQLDAQSRAAAPAEQQAGPTVLSSEAARPVGRLQQSAAADSLPAGDAACDAPAAIAQEAVGAEAGAANVGADQSAGQMLQSNSPAAVMLEQLCSTQEASQPADISFSSPTEQSTSQPPGDAIADAAVAASDDAADEGEAAIADASPTIQGGSTVGMPSASTSPFPQDSFQQQPAGPSDTAADEFSAIADSTAWGPASEQGQEAMQDTDGASAADEAPADGSDPPGLGTATPAAQWSQSLLDRLQRPSSAAMQSPNKSKYARSESSQAGLKMSDHPVGELAS